MSEEIELHFLTGASEILQVLHLVQSFFDMLWLSQKCRLHAPNWTVKQPFAICSTHFKWHWGAQLYKLMGLSKFQESLIEADEAKKIQIPGMGHMVVC